MLTNLKISKIQLLVILLTYLTGVLKANSTDMVNIVANDNNLSLLVKYGVYIDSSLKYTLNNVLHEKYVSYGENKINLGINKYNNWVRVKIVSKIRTENLVIEVENPIIDQVEYYLTLNNNLLDSGFAGECVGFKARNNNFSSYVFNLKLDSGLTYDVFLKLKSSEQLNAPVFIRSKDYLIKKEINNNTIDGIYFGIILVMVFYNLFIFIITRDSSYFYYIFYIFTVGLTQAILNGYAFKYFWPNNTLIAQFSTVTAGAISGIATIFFVRKFLNTKQFCYGFHKLLYVYLFAYFLVLILTTLGYLNEAYKLTNFTAGVGSITLLITSIYVYVKHKNRSAMFFIVAWLIFIISIVVFVLKDIGLIRYSYLSVKGLQIGSAIEVVLLSFALADKINILKKEKETAQAEALNSARENERITKEQNVILEQKVVERTTELTETNNNLSVALNDLKQAQTQLVESEKMASLGQLTAGIAHEINNPINFVTSNIKPLERDINDLYTLQNETEKLLNDNEQAIQQIKKYKADIDFDYLKTEISFLLKGIHEGSSRTAEIVKGLRIFSRVDEDDIKLANINEGLDSTIIIVNNQLNNKIVIEKNYANLPFVECYPGKLNQVFLNLISNAIYAVKQKFEENDGGKLIIKTEQQNNNAIITISDNGTGMSKETKNKLFEPFFTTKPVGEGTGLGLSITYNTIKKHNGSVSVESTLGEGTTFKIIIPINQSNE